MKTGYCAKTGYRGRLSNGLLLSGLLSGITMLCSCTNDNNLDNNTSLQAPPPFIVVDQFGYQPQSVKVAVLRSPEKGFDKAYSYTPGATIELVNHITGAVESTISPIPWRNGETDKSSGDKAWWVDFTNMSKPGRYYLRDPRNGTQSPMFNINANVFDEVLKHAMRTYFYQRAGYAKKAPYTSPAWEDLASHLGPGQDIEARLYSDPHNAETERDLSGGWYDAGDYNKYTAWHADNLITLLHAYRERPQAWGDNYDIPESNNGIADIIDEILWGMHWLEKMQNPDGGVLCILSLDHASPPSAAKGPSFYGPATTHATLLSAAAFAFGAQVLQDAALHPDHGAYANRLLERAEQAWQWAVKNPSTTFFNNQGDAVGVGAGQQETDDAGREADWRRASVYLFAATEKPRYHEFFKQHYQQTSLIAWSGNTDNFREPESTTMLFYSEQKSADRQIADRLRKAYLQAISRDTLSGAIDRQLDPYRAYIEKEHFVWGSNSIHCRQGLLFANIDSYQLQPALSAKSLGIAKEYLHYIHGVNPLGLVYLSNMYMLGVENSVNEIYHSWFTDGSSRWDRVASSTFGPPPGYLVGGPNPTYNWDQCCPQQCGSSENNDKCFANAITPPRQQPVQKSYKDFNTSWPLNSWTISENSNNYQANYVRLLSKFVTPITL